MSFDYRSVGIGGVCVWGGGGGGGGGGRSESDMK